jgi:hypothetical protein
MCRSFLAHFLAGQKVSKMNDVALTQQGQDYVLVVVTKTPIH